MTAVHRPGTKTPSRIHHLGTVGPMLDMEDSLLNSKEVAEILDCSPDTVNELARKSVLPAFKKGRQWRFRKRDISSFKRQLRGTTAA